ncbi:MAG: hypothetical protein GW794_04095 [Flavobacteriales bacterium]|nr:hypothetical protein [Flavobacteriales bacterium]NCQ15576.1 hypothetical protein [Flavobacteriales bacterium]NCQ57008.1 hypothetical protein [Flavobacteriales bacterium]
MLLFFAGCSCYKGPVSEFGFFRKDYKPENFDIDKNLYNIIDTTEVYERVGTFDLNNNEFYPYDDHKYGYNYLKFYANGKVSDFRRIRTDGEPFSSNPEPELSRNDFDPAKSAMGYFYAYDGKIFFNFFVRHRNCYGYFNKSEFIIKNDTLIEKNIQTINGKDIEVFYVKKNIPIEFLQGWQPDW